MRKLSPAGWIATSRVSFEMSTPTLCATVDLIFSQSSSCLGGITPGCPFRPLGKERGGQTTGQSFQIGALYDPSPPAAGLCRRQAGGARSCRIRRENDKTRQGALSAQLRHPSSRSGRTDKRRNRPVGVEDFLQRPLSHHHPRHLWIKPTNTVAADHKVGRVENLALDEVQHGPIDFWPL